MNVAARRAVLEAVRLAKAALAEQLFWGYPPPMVDEGDGGLELYRRYKYGGKGRESRRWFRDRARREAAKWMVEARLRARAGRGT